MKEEQLVVAKTELEDVDVEKLHPAPTNAMMMMYVMTTTASSPGEQSVAVILACTKDMPRTMNMTKE